MAETLSAPNWAVLEKLSRISGFPFGTWQMPSNLRAQSSDRRRLFRSLVLAALASKLFVKGALTLDDESTY